MAVPFFLSLYGSPYERLGVDGRRRKNIKHQGHQATKTTKKYK
jgi:hypothetical protein